MAKTLPRIHVIATGGTISYRAADVKQERSFADPRFNISQLLEQMPQAQAAAQLTAEQIFQIGSTSISDAHWLKLARRVNELLADPGLDGIVITHGTDTMEETAFFPQLGCEKRQASGPDRRHAPGRWNLRRGAAQPHPRDFNGIPVQTPGKRRSGDNGRADFCCPRR